ncbi:unnamed protein product [Miscanthus lutarioriparius]|uniref:Golgi apparatus membrane protein TVP23 n=1 Tax=Miscanthus lutarioriparius TaxID=422564 RepID=A0A811P0W7_9POAL|nr:unnamed protein product [Miscanthus lutarioriparius]
MANCGFEELAQWTMIKPSCSKHTNAVMGIIESRVLAEAAAWIILGIFSLIRLQADYLLVVGVCLSLSIANIIGFTKCNKDAKKNIQDWTTNALLSGSVRSHLQSAFGV